MTTEIHGKNKGEIVEQLAEKFQVGTTTIYARFGLAGAFEQKVTVLLKTLILY